MLVVWDTQSATPVRTFLNPHTNGVKCMDLSSDCQYIVTLGAEDALGEMQTISLWDWLNEAAEGPIINMIVNASVLQNQYWIKFNPENNHEIAINGAERVAFLSWQHSESKFEFYGCRVDQKDFTSKERYQAHKTKTVFLSGTQAVTGTERGDILVWDESLIIEGVGEQNEKRLIKVVTLN